MCCGGAASNRRQRTQPSFLPATHPVYQPHSTSKNKSQVRVLASTMYVQCTTRVVRTNNKTTDRPTRHELIGRTLLGERVLCAHLLLLQASSALIAGTDSARTARLPRQCTTCECGSCCFVGTVLIHRVFFLCTYILFHHSNKMALPRLRPVNAAEWCT